MRKIKWILIAGIFIAALDSSFAQFFVGQPQLSLRTQIWTTGEHMERFGRDSISVAVFQNIRSRRGAGADSTIISQLFMQYVYADSTAGMTLAQVFPTIKGGNEYRFLELSETQMRLIDSVFHHYRMEAFNGKQRQGVVQLEEELGLYVQTRFRTCFAHLMIGSSKEPWLFAITDWPWIRETYDRCKREALRDFSREARSTLPSNETRRGLLSQKRFQNQLSPE